jgi:hypothetical protein
MEQRNRRNEERRGGGSPEGDQGEDLKPLAERGAAFFAAGAAAIEAALSGDSQAFLNDNRQEGGQ